MRLRQAREERQPGERLRRWAVADIVIVGARFAESRRLQIDDAGIYLAQLLVAQPPLLHLPGAEILANRIGAAHHPLEQVASLRMVKVERDAVFAGIRIVVVSAAIKVAANPMAARRPLAL